MTAKTLMLTTTCSAGCSHCPFANPKMEKRHLSLGQALNGLKNSDSPLVVLSGGEPFEYESFKELLKSLRELPTRTRIATGGHLPLKPFLSMLKEIPHFEGLSLGTDVISTRSKAVEVFSLIWRANLRLLNEQEVPYSLTFTLPGNLKEFTSLATKIKLWGAQPQFIYLRLQEGASQQQAQKVFSDIYPHINLVFDKLG